MANGDLYITVTVDVPATVVSTPTTGTAQEQPQTGKAAPRPTGGHS